MFFVDFFGQKEDKVGRSLALLAMSQVKVDVEFEGLPSPTCLSFIWEDEFENWSSQRLFLEIPNKGVIVIRVLVREKVDEVRRAIRACKNLSVFFPDIEKKQLIDLLGTRHSLKIGEEPKNGPA